MLTKMTEVAAPPSHPWRKLARVAFGHAIRHILGRWWDPPIRYVLDGESIELPLSHLLPLIRATHSHYSTNLTRVVRALHRKYPALHVIDVGANIGDSVILVKKGAPCPILSIEGDQRFCAFLRRNTAKWRDVVVVEAFVGDSTERGSLTFVPTSAGSGRVVGVAETGGLGTMGAYTLDSPTRVRTLDNILDQYGAFRTAKLVKIDTDGSDLEILFANRTVLAKSRAAVFFEYDPAFFFGKGVTGADVFSEFVKMGYTKALVWMSEGDYLAAIDLTNKGLLEDVDGYFTGRENRLYADICLFHAEDNDLAEIVRQEELAFFRSFRARGIAARG